MKGVIPATIAIYQYKKLKTTIDNGTTKTQGQAPFSLGEGLGVRLNGNCIPGRQRLILVQ